MQTHSGEHNDDTKRNFTPTLFSETRGTRGAAPFPLPCPVLLPVPEDPDPGLLPAVEMPDPGLAMPNVEQWTKPS